MCSDECQHDTKENSHEMSDDHSKASVGKRVGEALILALYLVIDAFEIWPHSHLFALASIPLGVLALMLLDGGFSKKTTKLATVVVAALCACLYVLSGPSSPVTHLIRPMDAMNMIVVLWR
jgi:hypothetical protein